MRPCAQPGTRGLTGAYELANKTGAGRVRASSTTPAIRWHVDADPIVLCILTRTNHPHAKGNNEVIAETTRLLVSEFA